MSNVLPELKKGDVLVTIRSNGEPAKVTVRKVGRGKEFDEPVYFLIGGYGGKLKKPYTGEELASMGFRVLKRAGQKADQSAELSQNQAGMKGFRSTAAE